jgi:hypothetical protein
MSDHSLGLTLARQLLSARGFKKLDSESPTGFHTEASLTDKDGMGIPLGLTVGVYPADRTQFQRGAEREKPVARPGAEVLVLTLEVQRTTSRPVLTEIPPSSTPDQFANAVLGLTARLLAREAKSIQAAGAADIFRAFIAAGRQGQAPSEQAVKPAQAVIEV